MSNENKNIELWKSVEKTDGNYLKEVQYPFPHLSIDAQYQILQATKIWGSYGFKWGVKDERFTPVMTGNDLVCSIIYTATFFYPDGSFPINADIGLYILAKGKYKENNDYIKKVSTDALTKGLSKLGFSADVFMGGFDGNKYTGIESFGNKEDKSNKLATKEQIDKLYKCVNALRSPHPVRAAGLEKLIVKDMFEHEALKLYDSACRVLGQKI